MYDGPCAVRIDNARRRPVGRSPVLWAVALAAWPVCTAACRNMEGMVMAEVDAIGRRKKRACARNLLRYGHSSTKVRSNATNRPARDRGYIDN